MPETSALQYPRNMKTVAFLVVSFLYFRYTLSSFPKNSLEIVPVDDVYEYLWESNFDIASETLDVDFLQQMQSGSLQAERYIKFTMQDINYILTVTKMLEEMSEDQIQPDDLRDFIKDRYLSYKKYTDFMLKRFSFKSEPNIQPTPEMFKYLSDYNKLKNDPLYFAVALLPCARLWTWLGNNLETPSNNAYYTWKVENMGGHPEKHYKELLNKHLDTLEKVEKANDIFRKQMQNEHDFFNSS